MEIYYLEHTRYSIKDLQETFSINFLQAICLSTHVVTTGQVYLPTYFNSEEEGGFGTYKHIVEDLAKSLNSPEGLKKICLASDTNKAKKGAREKSEDEVRSILDRLFESNKDPSNKAQAKRPKPDPFFETTFRISDRSLKVTQKLINPRSGRFSQFQALFDHLEQEDLKALNAELKFWIKSFKADQSSEIGEDYYSALSYHTLKNISQWQNYPVFKWPTINFDLIRGNPDFFSNELKLKEEGLLGKMGYHVGTSGVGQKKRREILADVLEMPSEQIQRLGFHDYWGNAKDTSRLKAMAFAIFCFINCRKTNPSMIYAIGDWRDDLDWLKANYYDNLAVKPFEWPDC